MWDRGVEGAPPIICFVCDCTCRTTESGVVIIRDFIGFVVFFIEFYNLLSLLLLLCKHFCVIRIISYNVNIFVFSIYRNI